MASPLKNKPLRGIASREMEPLRGIASRLGWVFVVKKQTASRYRFAVVVVVRCEKTNRFAVSLRGVFVVKQTASRYRFAVVVGCSWWCCLFGW